MRKKLRQNALIYFAVRYATLLGPFLGPTLAALHLERFGVLFIVISQPFLARIRLSPAFLPLEPLDLMAVIVGKRARFDFLAVLLVMPETVGAYACFA